MADNVIETGRSRIEDILLKASNGEALSRIEEILLDLYQDIVHLDPDTGLIPTDVIPPQVFERMITVADDTARFALTTDDVQNGDWVYVNSTQIMYFVSDEDHLDTEAGYTPVAAGIAAKAVGDKNGNDISTTYQPVINNNNKLSADLVDDTNATNKFTNATEKQTWNGKQDALTFDSAPTESSTNPVTSGGVYTALSGKQSTIDSDHKLSADNVDDTSATNKFATAAQLAQIGTNENNILSLQGKVKAHSEGGTDYDVINGIRVYVSATQPTGDIPVGSLWIGG